MPEPSVDILIPVFNAAETIQGAIESIQAQTVRDIRIIVVDDGSTDSTPAILSALASQDPRIEIVSQAANGGIVEALNTGLGRCRAEYLARHDGDDLAHPDRLAKQLAFLRSHPDHVAVGGAVRHVDAAGRPLGHIARLAPPELANPHWAPTIGPYITHPFLMTYRSSVEQIGGYRYAFHAEDTDLFWRLQELGRLHNLDDVLGDYRMHENSISSRSVVNGRIVALSSELAGISALRRRHGQPDLTFRKEGLREYLQAESLERIFRLGARQLTRTETDSLEISLAAKLLELTSYRPFELDVGDCRFIRRALVRHIGRLVPANRSTLRRMWAGTAARLLSKARFREAKALAAPQLYPEVMSRVAFRTLTTHGVRRSIRRFAGREISLK
ncbi:MAG: glycosyltransferase family 2 protein [Acetobacteraceae bacterium]|nr:glycosyltransferase family 2 protein [Acetobacteraceae bacterium]